MPPLDQEDEYTRHRRLPGVDDIRERWVKASEAFRSQADAELDQGYGPGERQRYDLFGGKAAGPNTPLAVYIHGGYWQRGDRKELSFVARELNARGITVAIPSYTLCPAAKIIDIVGEMRRLLATLWQRTKQRPVVIGHSAGGHLAAAMLATDWSKVGDVPADLVRSAYSLSGVFELEPLVKTSLNEALRLDPQSAREASPILWRPPPGDRTFIAAVGADESQEFIRQSLEITGKWSRAGVKAECVIVPSANHFTILEELVRPESAMLARVVGLTRQ